MAANTTITKQRVIRYFNRDFSSLKRDLTEHLKIHFKDNWTDFNESSSGMMLLELMAYAGDTMSFYLDKRFNESFIQTAKENKNILKHAKQLGFRTNVFGKSAASGKVDVFIKVPSTTLNEKIEPNTDFAGVTKKGAKLLGANGIVYETLYDIDFGNVNINDSKFAAIAEVDQTTGKPTSFALKVEGVDIKAGETKSQTFTIGSYEAFKTITIADSDVL